MKLLIATSNEGKIREIKRMLEPLGFEIVRPPREVEVQETGGTFLENAYLKAKAYYVEFGMPSLADDSGLVVESLGGYPGVFSSRFHEIEFGGREPIEGSKDEANVSKLLRLLEGESNRRAKFVATVVLYLGDRGLFAEGECRGFIADQPKGKGGFGYDPVFVPEGSSKTMAELSPQEKDLISHRGKALRNLLSVLEKCEL